MALSKLKKFVTEEVMDENNEDEYYDADKAVVPGNGKMILLEPRAYFLSGTVYALGGDLQKIGMGIFLCTPKNVNVEGTISEEDDKNKKKTDIDLEW